MISAIIALLGSSAVGSLIGGMFAFLNRKADMAVKQIELAHEQARWSHELASKDKDLEIARAEAQGAKDVAIIEGDSRIETARMEAIGQVQVAERITADEIRAAGKLGWLYVLAAVFNKLIRPVLTLSLAGAALWLNWIVIGRMTDGWETLTVEQRFEVGMQAFAWITAQASTAFGYWFVSRGVGK